MQLHATTTAPLLQDCLVVPVWGKKPCSATLTQVLDASLHAMLALFLEKTTSLHALGDTIFFTPAANNGHTLQILCVYFGESNALALRHFRKAMDSVAARIEELRCQSIALVLEEITFTDSSVGYAIRSSAIAMQQATYRYEKYKSAPKARALQVITYLMSAVDVPTVELALSQAAATVHGLDFSMDLANCPPNVCHPEYLATQAQQLADTYASLTTTIINAQELQALGAGAILAVGQGSKYPPRFIIVEYRGAETTVQPHILVGKGITFDTGGINLKPFEGMLGMKYDMCGAASVLGVMRAVAELNLTSNVVGILAVAENMIGPEAYRPEDVITSLSGQTIEVLNTDAEGRLVLCDALTYIARYNPKTVIDIATLTGAIITCLGDVHSGLFSPHDDLAHAIQAAGQACVDPVWRLPMHEAYDALLNSSLADMKNIGGAAAGSSSAACFLGRFTQKYTWAHLDIAGTASVKNGLNRKATGRPVALLLEYLLQQVEK